ncbi:hypothetical protein SARC_00376 [Sphaeroforma arctica JP610]|uniref:Radical SAM core domain-containing protein n=1 Tax=Sphaeroforma arctica JP610 TaxID=667725 RepID=A0A0L0GEP5_9EUKA|nr:hypothetical protein SARC_00376 [Sphaeroforma arctica JP610]KNC87490.1 hypothetical protein SARC_00376 [Sphaeroforma arctica JP610]|eukprot:XP_014161392.1 hypothetical protein SARC_00376 [Sphaeroforma arctica JP610]
MVGATSAALAGRYMLQLRSTTPFSNLYKPDRRLYKLNRRMMYLTANPVTKTRDTLDTRAVASRDVAVYIHWPYCKKMCSYCNFNRYVKDNVDHERMRNCLVTELKTALAATKPTSIRSVFFGGGTPTLAQPQTIKALLDVMTDAGLMQKGVTEVTMEGNPSSTEIQQMELFRNAGVNRMSLGVQSLISPEDLLFLGRNHSIDEAMAAVEVARTLFPGRFSIDLIFGRPGQTRTQWQDELNAAMQLVDGHVSLCM